MRDPRALGWVLSVVTSRMFTGFSWDTLPDGVVLVDVGGGIGSQSVLVAQAHPHIRVVVEDREQVVATAADVRPPSFPLLCTLPLELTVAGAPFVYVRRRSNSRRRGARNTRLSSPRGACRGARATSLRPGPRSPMLRRPLCSSCA